METIDSIITNPFSEIYTNRSLLTSWPN